MAMLSNALGVTVKFKLDGREETLCMADVTYGTWIDLKHATGFTPMTLLGATQEVDMEAIGALIWLARRQSEPGLTWPTFVSQLSRREPTFELVSVDVKADAEEENEPDPTTAG